MHGYAMEGKGRERAILVLAAVAILLAYGFSVLLQSLKVQVPWWVDAPSVLGFYGAVFGIYDRWFWRVRLGPVRFSPMPNLAGRWDGKLTSSHRAEQVDIVVTIRQTWTRIQVRMETSNSRSASILASLVLEDRELAYEYSNEPRATAVATMQSHRGTCHIRFSESLKEADGDYYSGRGRQNFGSFRLVRSR